MKALGEAFSHFKGRRRLFRGNGVVVGLQSKGISAGPLVGVLDRLGGALQEDQRSAISDQGVIQGG